MESTESTQTHSVGGVIQNYYIQGDQYNGSYNASVKVEGIGNKVTINFVTPTTRQGERSLDGRQGQKSRHCNTVRGSRGRPSAGR